MRLSARLFSQQKQRQLKLIYEGRFTNRILYLKSFSLLTSVGLAGSYKYVLAKKGFSAGLAIVGLAYTPFFASPLVIAWFFKRYITKLYYDPGTETFTAHHYGALLSKKQLSFKKEDVIRADLTSMLNTFKVGKKPFFLHEEDLVDFEAVEIYREMVGLGQVPSGREDGISDDLDKKQT